MELEQMRQELKDLLKPSRYQHSIGVEEVSHDLAVIYGCDVYKACIAGILHDCVKYMSGEELLNECRRLHIAISKVEECNTDLLHAKVGAIHARECYGICDEEILNAIIYHTTGRPGMTLLEKIIFTADYIEPYRKPLPRIQKIRQMAYENLDLAIIMILENTLEYLNSTGALIDTLTNDTFEYYRTKMITTKQ